MLFLEINFANRNDHHECHYEIISVAIGILSQRDGTTYLTWIVPI
jgi:hypothetical protein